MSQLNEDAVFGYKIQAQEETETSLSLAVRLADADTNMPPSGRVRLSVEGSPVRPVKNVRGDYLFFRLTPKEEYFLIVESELYETARVGVTVPDHSDLLTLSDNGKTKLVSAAELMKKILTVVNLKKKEFA